VSDRATRLARIDRLAMADLRPAVLVSAALIASGVVVWIVLGDISWFVAVVAGASGVLGAHLLARRQHRRATRH
jgi:hypothetical protein